MESDLWTKCRGCLSGDTEMHNLFDLMTEDLTLANILSETTSIQIDESKEFSPYLCVKCTEIVVAFYNFKVHFTQSQTYFQNELKKLSKDYQNNCQNLFSSVTFGHEDKAFENDNELLKNNKIEVNEVASPLGTPIKDETKEQNLLEANTQIKPEVGEFTVQNELVQLIESVVFYCKSCKQDYFLKEDFVNHMNTTHGKPKVNASKFTKTTLVKLPLGKIIEEKSDLDFKTDLQNEEKCCRVCNMIVLRSEYESHFNEHKKHLCSCGSKYLRRSDLVNHKRSKHSDERNFVCEYCDKAFKIKQLLTKHRRLHTHPRSEICHICGQIFNDKSVLNTHIKLKHFPTRNYQCCQCGLKFSLKSTLQKHIRRHNTNRKKTVSCSMCNMTYFDKSTLNRHIAVKHSDQPITAKCEYCGKTFSSKGNLYKHLRTLHKYDKVFVGNDGTIAVQKPVESLKSPPPLVSYVTNFVL